MVSFVPFHAEKFYAVMSHSKAVVLITGVVLTVAVLCVILAVREAGPRSITTLIRGINHLPKSALPPSWLSKDDIKMSPMLHDKSASVIMTFSRHQPKRSVQVKSKATLSKAGSQEELSAKPMKVEQHAVVKTVVNASKHHESTPASHTSRNSVEAMPTKSEWKRIVKNAEKEAEKLAQKHPRSVLGAHWRDSLTPKEDYQSQLRQDSKDATRAKTDAQSESLALEDAHMKHVGIYQKAACKEKNSCGQARGEPRVRPAGTGGKVQSSSKKLAPARYPAVSFYAQLREEDPQYRKDDRGAKQGNDGEEGHRRRMARLRLETKHSLPRSDSRSEAHKPETFQDYMFRLFTGKSSLSKDLHDHARSSQLYNIPRDAYSEGLRPDGGEHVVQNAQERLARKWLDLMRNPPPVTKNTRPDMLDPRSLVRDR